MVLHVIFYFTDSLPLFHTVFSLICHVVYLQNFSSTWPLISLTSVSFLASCVLVISDHFIWFFYFARMTNEARHSRQYRAVQPEPPGFSEIASFFALCVWYAPLFLFLSLSANDNALPMTAGKPFFFFGYPVACDTKIHTLLKPNPPRRRERRQCKPLNLASRLSAPSSAISRSKAAFQELGQDTPEGTPLKGCLHPARHYHLRFIGLRPPLPSEQHPTHLRQDLLVRDFKN
jgi:hypothetical protein